MEQNSSTNTGKAYIGIDVGAKGVITLWHDNSLSFYPMLNLDYWQIARILDDIRNAYSEIACVIEDVHAIFGSSAKGTFNFGFNKGVLVGLLCAHKIPFTLVQPKEWQTEMWTNADKEYTTKEKMLKGEKKTVRTIDTKATSINAAKRLFPAIDLRRTPECKNIDDNKVDSLLMCEYARRKNL
jgi:hypothetical protein